MTDDSTTPAGFWAPGSEVLWVYEPSSPGRAGPVHPVTVIADDADGLVVWLAAGTPTLDTVRTDGRDKRADKSTMFTAERVQVRSVWRGAHNVRIAPAGARWSVWCFFDADTWAFNGWYVNLERPHRREANATVSHDLVLDVLVSPDRRHARKDEDELLEAIRQGRFSAEEADGIRRIADAAEAVIDAWGAPFCDGWERFRPDPTWPVPGLPADGWPPGRGLPPASAGTDPAERP